MNTHYKHFKAIRPSAGVIGHRGLPAVAPENTLASFQAAKSHGIDWVEFDVRLINDGSLIIFHDDTLNRTTNGQGPVDTCTMNDLINLDAGSWYHQQFINQRIPLLKDALPILKKLNLHLNIELKVPKGASPEFVATLGNNFSKLVNEFYSEPDDHMPLISSFHWPLLKLVKQKIPNAPLGFLTEHCDDQIITEIGQIPNAALHCHYAALEDSLINALHQYQLPFIAYTVNQPADAARLLDAGAFAIISDTPHDLIKLPNRL